MEYRDPRFAELDRLIVEADRPKFRHTMSAAAVDSRRLNGLKGIIGQIAVMTEIQRHQHGKRAQLFRVYRVTCECGKCRKCRHRAAKRKYNQSRAKARQPKRQRYVKGEIPHGTFTGYNQMACRCQVCRDFITANAKRRKVA